MRITHTISLNVSEIEKMEFARLGISLPCGFATFKIDEADSRWNEVSKLVVRSRASDVPSTTFSAAELEGAVALQVLPSWHHSYPQPSDNFAYMSATYDCSNHCARCGLGLVQKAPFRLKREPRWGRKSILQVNWVFDEFFIKSDVWQQVFRPLQINMIPVLDAKTLTPLHTVVQLDISARTSFRLADYPYEQCESCRRIRYSPTSRGFAPEPDSIPSDMFKSVEWFGSGAKAYRAIAASYRLYRLMRDAKVEGAHFEPCALTRTTNQ